MVATLRTQPTSALIRCLVGTDRPVQRKLACGCANRSGNMSILGSAAKRRHRANAQTAAKNGSAVGQRVFPSCACGFSPLVWFPFLFWTTLFASWGSVSFSSVPCQASTVPFLMTSPYVGGASSSFLLKPNFTHVSRYAPGSPTPGVSKPTPTRPPALVSYVRLRT